METTAIVAELLVIGAEALMWVFLLICSIRGYSQVQAAIGRWPQWTAAALVPLAYGIGIVVDRIADRAVFPLLKKYDGLHRDRLKSLRTNDGVTRFLEYIRSRFRIARATTLNLALITIFGALALTWPLQQKLEAIAAGVAATGVALWVTLSIDRTYVKWLTEINEETAGTSSH